MLTAIEYGVMNLNKEKQGAINKSRNSLPENLCLLNPLPDNISRDTNSVLICSRPRLLFIKLQHSAPLDPYYERCPDMKCDKVFVTILEGTLSDADCSQRAYGTYFKDNIQDSTPVLLPQNMGMTSGTPPENYGARETRPFLTREPVDGGFGDWGDWEECSVTCGGGVQVKRRLCDNPMPEHGGQNCDESLEARYQTQPCNTQAC